MIDRQAEILLFLYGFPSGISKIGFKETALIMVGLKQQIN